MKKYITPVIFCLFLSTLVCQGLQAQSLSSEDIKAQMLKDWERAKLYTIDYLNAMPADKYSFKAVDSIRSFAQQLLHLASGNVYLMSKVTDQKPLPAMMTNLEKSATAQQKDSVMYYVTSSYDYCIEVIKNSDINKWGETIPKLNATRWAVMMKAFEHQTHHRGQATIYIRLEGIRPPAERLF